ncbi:MAG TPA: RHS repeat-associated core domain-containing protein [Acidothermaceae bacterium]
MVPRPHRHPHLRTVGQQPLLLPSTASAVVALINHTGSAVDTYSYDPYGNTRTSTGTTFNPFHYTGGYHDPSGLYHYGARCYDPTLRRFTQQDLTGQETNLYTYPGNDPVNGIDPSGQFSFGGVLAGLSGLLAIDYPTVKILGDVVAEIGAVGTETGYWEAALAKLSLPGAVPFLLIDMGLVGPPLRFGCDSAARFAVVGVGCGCWRTWQPVGLWARPSHMRLLVAVVASAVVTTAASLTVEERFAIVPEWLLDADVSDAAIRLYAVLLRYGQSSGARMPGRATLARRLRKKSVDTIDRAMRELVDIGAVVVEHRYDGPQRLTNRYHLHARRPGGVSNDFDASSGGGRVNAATPKESDQPDLADAAGGGRKYAAGVAAPVRHNPKHFTQSTTTSPQPPAATADERNLWRAEEDRFLQSLGIADADAYAAEIGALRRDAGHAGGLMNLHSVIRARSRLRSEHVIGCRDELQMRHRGHVGSEQRRGKPLGREFAGGVAVQVQRADGDRADAQRECKERADPGRRQVAQRRPPG